MAVFKGSRAWAPSVCSAAQPPWVTRIHCSHHYTGLPKRRSHSWLIYAPDLMGFLGWGQDPKPIICIQCLIVLISHPAGEMHSQHGVCDPRGLVEGSADCMPGGDEQPSNISATPVRCGVFTVNCV